MTNISKHDELRIAQARNIFGGLLAIGARLSTSNILGGAVPTQLKLKDLSELETLYRVRVAVEALIVAEVKNRRGVSSDNKTWAGIAKDLCISESGAFRKFGRLPGVERGGVRK
jgi:hypothetical protein